MEFLLINHPLDCPICDQGGECELQDLAMGYGRSISRFTERKRVVKDKNLGPLISTDMTRCIHCTRCVRFLEEIAGTAEMGGIGRGEKTEISTFIERNIDSELSGNIIDLCPVGALTNKPFRFSARAWELTARAGVGSHDCVGSNLHYHVRAGQIMRAVPRDNENINECWLSDRDRYGHFGLQADDRVTVPRIKRDGQWQECDWDTAIQRAVELLRAAADKHGADSIGVLASPRATSEEHLLLARLADGLGTPHRDHRLRLADDRDPVLGRARMDRPSKDLSQSDAILLVGSHLRHDQPILNHRVRSAWRTRAAKIMDLNPVAWKFPFDFHRRVIVAPQDMVLELGRVVRAGFELKGQKLPETALGRFLAGIEADDASTEIARSLSEAADGFVLLGDQALQHPDASLLRALAETLARALEVALMALPGAANSEGAVRAGMVPAPGGMSAARQLEKGLRAFVLHDIEPGFDTVDPQATQRALGAADAVIAIGSFAGTDLLDVADVVLPLAPVPETEGTYVNLDGLRQSFRAIGKPPGQARPGWKILRVLGGSLGIDGFDFVDLDDLTEALDASALSTTTPAQRTADGEFEMAARSRLWRAGPVPMFSGDSMVRRSPALQRSHHADNGTVAVHPATAKELEIETSARVRVRQGAGSVEAELVLDSAIAEGALLMPAGSCLSSGMGPAWGPVEVERA
jgi:NADH-quinone oxidoreductase subunit G